jgi:hypothetical protein
LKRVFAVSAGEKTPFLQKVSRFIVVVMLCGFLLLNLSDIKKVNNDWMTAGEISRKAVLGFNETFVQAHATPPNPVFYFVNVPIKYGEAWVFPVGLPDALWFTFQNENLTVVIRKNLDLALDEAEGSGSARVFEFDKAGNIFEVTRLKTPANP